jgi:hypothetical protein
MLSPAEFASKLIRRLYLKTRVLGFWADLSNIVKRSSVTGDVPVAVSLTTHGMRVARVHRTIEAIGRGRVKPRRLILWLGLAQKGRPLPRSIRRLQRRGLEVCYAEDVGPHTKYFPYVCSEPQHRLAMVTADDDMWYPAFWLERLWQAHSADPAHVHCYRARRVMVGATALEPYIGWPFVDHDRLEATVFPTGVGGVIYPPALLDCLRRQGPAFKPCCPKADDLWLHVVALRHGFTARQLAAEAMEFELMPSTQSIGLQKQNVWMSHNDVQAAATYLPDDLARLRS